jgi:serine O-acetyltransferase
MGNPGIENFHREIMGPLTLYRIAHWLHQRHVPVLPRVFKILNFLIFHAIIPYEARIGRVKLEHRGLGVVIHPNTTIADGVLVHHHVTIATDVPPDDERRTYIGEDAVIYPHSIILGPRSIGARATVRAGSVVTKDVPEGMTVRGNPAR